MTQIKTPCPKCDATITIENADVGEIITCKECSAELELRELNPPKLEDAPDTQEDWGE